jgi:phospholipid/cholesterol/gamma-HCH transport system ATP-binding protein
LSFSQNEPGFAISEIEAHVSSDVATILNAQSLAAVASDSCSPYIELKDVSMGFGTNQVLDGVSFGIMPGQSLCIMGRSGVGKSISLRLMMGFLKPDSGRVIAACEDVTNYSDDQLEEIHKKITLAFQSGALFDSLSLPSR